MVYTWLQRDFKERVETIWATLGLVILILLVYGIQLIIVGDLEPRAAYEVVSEWIQPNPGFYLFLSPLLHSYHEHVVHNVVLLLISGTLTERRIGSRPLLFFVYGSGVITNVSPGLLGYGGYGVGISGAFYGLWTFVGITYTIEWWDELDRETRNYMRLLGYPALWLIGLGHLVTAVFQYVGLLAVTPGAATGAHLTGVIFGVILFIEQSFTSPAWKDSVSEWA